MVSVSVRRDGREPVGRNAQSASSWRGSAEQYSENPGLIEQVDGFYDWAGRRLFLADGSPDPMTSGAYRYQTRPDLCDLSAHASDPASPHYEPPHLRHRPGDTWEIGGKPHDPDDPGVYGSAGWRPDPRTGRHRRNELPDPVPPWEAAEDEREVAKQEQVTADQPTPAPRRRSRFWQDDSEEGGDDAPAGGEGVQGDSWRFDKLREDAWDRFVIKSSELAAAHWVDRRALDSQHRWPVTAVLRLVRWMIAVFQGRNETESATPVAARPPLPRQVQPQADRSPEPARPSQTDQAAQPDRTARESRPVPGAQMAQAIRSVQAARVRLAATARREESSETKTTDGAAHWRNRPRQERPRPSPLPYIARWERAFDAHRAFGEVAL